MKDTTRLRQIAAAAPQALGENGAWLATGIEEWLAGRAKTLDDALDVTRQGGKSPRIQARNARRDALLRAFARTYLGTLETARQAAFLVTELGEFESCAWPRLSGLAECLPNINVRKRALFELFKVGGVPSSEKQLRRILGGRDIH